MMTTYTVFSPDEVNFPLGVIDKKGNVLSGVRALDAIIANAKKGCASDKAYNLHCVPSIKQPKEADFITLGALLRRASKLKDKDSESKRFPVKKKDLSKPIIKSGNRYKSKVDWTSDRVRNQVQGLLEHGKSLSFIARHLGVSRSTLTMANKRHNHRLYIPDVIKA